MRLVRACVDEDEENHAYGRDVEPWLSGLRLPGRLARQARAQAQAGLCSPPTAWWSTSR